MSNNLKHIVEIANGFYNARGSFTVFLKLIDIGTHMSFIRLSNGNYLIIDAIQLSPQLKREIDLLTHNGSKIEAFVGTHPFHTMHIPAFHENYPNIPYYGCPRHIRQFPNIPWVGDLNDCTVRNTWSEEVELRIPDGAEFVAPLPEKSNHFSSVFVYHKASRTIHVDDTICYSAPVGFFGGLLRFAGHKDGLMTFHPSLKNVGLLPAPDAPYLFRDWVKSLLEDWKFENICTAHTANKIGGAHQMLSNLLKESEPVFEKLRDQRLKGKIEIDDTEGDKEQTECG
eukprot:TRINITY_DN9038_c0_g1_i1.p1 TRINITY_DN9038_c0_g1~~TRINITY_DN9038_c0_g1_i1.p1  ORF type:complete len:295 (+),score=39.79 TRINITY_DN9038_c0_g1_i1:34-885(+)